MTVSEVLLKAKKASRSQTPEIIKDALRESYGLAKRVAATLPSNFPQASLYTDCQSLGNLLRRLSPLARDEDTGAALTEAINALVSAQIAILRNGAPPSESEVEQAGIKRDYEAYVANVKRALLPVRGGLYRHR